jgi:hypothetical protein
MALSGNQFSHFHILHLIGMGDGESLSDRRYTHSASGSNKQRKSYAHQRQIRHSTDLAGWPYLDNPSFRELQNFYGVVFRVQWIIVGNIGKIFTLF